MLGVVFKSSLCDSVAGADLVVGSGDRLGLRGIRITAAVVELGDSVEIEVAFDSVVSEDSEVEIGVLEAVMG